ncbi:lrr and pyd domains-containing protein 3-like [Limosa lapponica baueri]|uniref:Lrr and pyd domains-containing protein 3-like n=1 Tax=Limosa lapponica baueri TaxID=1758121 RepID=A0A2I0T1D0_LIMLA|nr:lrr and pyd domains-containing protein 3-like [Limosa lapponica baueri]
MPGEQVECTKEVSLQPPPAVALVSADSGAYRLKLRSCMLTSACCGYLATVLSTNLSMRDLDLSFNRLEDSGVQLLCEKLKRPDWQLQTQR